MAQNGTRSKGRQKPPPGCIELRSVHIALEDIEFIDAVAQHRGRSRAYYCRKAIEAQVARDRASRSSDRAA